MALALDIANHQTPIPTTLRKVLVSSAKTEWLVAMKCKFDSIVLNGTFELCPLGWKAISMCWVLKIKHDGSCKTRWVASSFLQHEGIDYLDTYGPIQSLENLCFLLSYTIFMGYEIHSMDINNAFLQALLDKDIYISQAKCFKSKETWSSISSMPSTASNKHLWPGTALSTSTSGFESTPADPCVYCYHEANKAYKNERNSNFCLNN